VGRGRYHYELPRPYPGQFGRAVSLFAGLIGTRARGLNPPNLDNEADMISRNLL
jgi:hypothetical protein